MHTAGMASPPQIGSDDDGLIVIGNDTGEIRMSAAAARDTAHRLLEWLGDEPELGDV